jgi:endonuclease/exonuclease/phosphatase family metal-dependent hydrolase
MMPLELRARQAVLILASLTLLEAACHRASAANEWISLRIVAFNVELLNAPDVSPGTIHKYRFNPARCQHLERVAYLIETLNPDIVNLVEVTSKEAVDRLIGILHEKGQTTYRGYHIDGHDSFTAADVAVITKYPLDEVDGKTIRTIYSEEDDSTWRANFRFHGRSGQMVTQSTSIPRNALYYITVGGHRLGFFGLHLKSNPQDEYANAHRMAEVNVACSALRSEIMDRGYLPIVLGDLNDYDPDVPDRDAARETRTSALRDVKDFAADREGPELVNVAERIARLADRYTSHWDWNENGAHDNEDVYTMIDHILLAQELMPFVTRAFICHSVSLDTSDHYPVVVDLSLPDHHSGPP